MEQSSDKSSGISISTVLFVVFLVLKLVGVISWSWWWVTAPIWIPCIIALSIGIIMVLLAVAFGK